MRFLRLAPDFRLVRTFNPPTAGKADATTICHHCGSRRSPFNPPTAGKADATTPPRPSITQRQILSTRPLLGRLMRRSVWLMAAKHRTAFNPPTAGKADATSIDMSLKSDGYLSTRPLLGRLMRRHDEDGGGFGLELSTRPLLGRLMRP